MPDQADVSSKRIAELDKKATEFTRALAKTEFSNGWTLYDGVADAKLLTEKFLDDALSLPNKAEGNAVLKMAQAKNDQMRRTDSWIPGLNIVFSHSTKQLTDVKLNYRHGANHGIETLDLFDP